MTTIRQRLDTAKLFADSHPRLAWAKLYAEDVERLLVENERLEMMLGLREPHFPGENVEFTRIAQIAWERGRENERLLAVAEAAEKVAANNSEHAGWEWENLRAALAALAPGGVSLPVPHSKETQALGRIIRIIYDHDIGNERSLGLILSECRAALAPGEDTATCNHWPGQTECMWCRNAPGGDTAP